MPWFADEESETAEERIVDNSSTLSPDPVAFSGKAEPTLGKHLNLKYKIYTIS